MRRDDSNPKDSPVEVNVEIPAEKKSPILIVSEKPINPEIGNNEKFVRAAQASMPLPVLEMQLDALRQQEDGQDRGKQEFDIGDEDNPAHAFCLVTKDLSQEAVAVLQSRIADYINKNPKNALSEVRRGNMLWGVLTSSSKEHLEAIVSELNKLMEEAEKELADIKGKSRIFIAEAAATKAVVTSLGEGRNALGIKETAGFVDISWASKSETSDNGEGIGKVVLVSSEYAEARRNKSIPSPRDHLIGDAKVVEVKVPSKKVKDKKVYLRSLESIVSTSEEVQKNITENATALTEIKNKLEGLGVDQRQKILEKATLGYTAEELLEDAVWKVGDVEGEYAEIKAAGERVAIKFDFSGMSKMAAAGFDSGEYFAAQFADFVQILEGQTKGENKIIKNFCASMEGDALMLQVMMPEGATSETIVKHLTEFQSELGNRFREKIHKDLKEQGVLSGHITEDQVGLKIAAKISKEPLTLKVGKGGVVEISDPEFDEWEDKLEAMAKKGGHTLAFLVSESEKEAVEKYLIENENLKHSVREVKDEKGEKRTIYLVKDTTVFDLRVEIFNESLKDSLIEKGREIPGGLINFFEEFHTKVDHGEGDSASSVQDVENNTITMAKVLCLLDSSGDINETQIAVIAKGIFSDKTIESILENWRQYKNKDGVDESQKLPAVEIALKVKGLMGVSKPSS